MVIDFETAKGLAQSYANDVRQVLPVERAILYGSYAKGNAGEDSDIDVCFFLSDFGDKNRLDIIFQLLRISSGNYKGIYFEPNAYPISEIERGNPFVEEILIGCVDL